MKSIQFLSSGNQSHSSKRSRREAIICKSRYKQVRTRLQQLKRIEDFVPEHTKTVDSFFVGSESIRALSIQIFYVELRLFLTDIFDTGCR